MSERISFRAVFAQVLLTGAPVLMEKRDDTSIRIEFATAAELTQWLVDSGIKDAEPNLLQGERETTHDGRTRHRSYAYPDNFHGWAVYVSATEYTDQVEPLDEATREQLAAVAQDGAA